MPPRKVKKLSSSREEKPNQEPRQELKEQVCTEKDVIKSFKEIGLGNLIDALGS